MREPEVVFVSRAVWNFYHSEWAKIDRRWRCNTVGDFLDCGDAVDLMRETERNALRAAVRDALRLGFDGPYLVAI